MTNWKGEQIDPSVTDAVVVSSEAAVINARHKDLEAEIETLRERAHTALEIAIEIGSLLNAAKVEAKHGSWSGWLQQLDFGAKRAQRYMLLWRNRDRIHDAGAASIREGLRLLSEEEEQEDRGEPQTSLSKSEPRSELELLQAQVESVVSSMHTFLDRSNNILSGSSQRAGHNLMKTVGSMLSQLVTWLPDSMLDCQKCGGNGVAPDPDGVMVHCDTCFAGKTGRYKGMDA